MAYMTLNRAYKNQNMSLRKLILHINTREFFEAPKGYTAQGAYLKSSGKKSYFSRFLVGPILL
jgi:hypothetical protein